MATKKSIQARRVMPAIRRNTVRAVQRVMTLGDLIAAACDVTGSVERASKLLSSDEMAARIGRRIVPA